MRISKEILEKIRSGDGLTDGELDLAIKFYGELLENLDCLGCEYRLFWSETRRTLDSLKSFKRARISSTV